MDGSYRPTPSVNWAGAGSEVGEILRGLGFATMGGAGPGAPMLWRRRKTPVFRPRPTQGAAPSPFAALAILKSAPQRKQRGRRRRVRAAARG